MSNQNDRGRNWSDVHQIIEFVVDALKNGTPYDLKKLISEVPAELRTDVLRKAILLEIEFYRGRGWTYNLGRDIDFPELKNFISVNLSNESDDSGFGLAESAVSGALHFAKCEYKADLWAFAEGGQGALYKASDRGLGDREVAIKVLKNVGESNRFRQEAEVTAKLDHPGIATVHSYSDSSDCDQSVDQRPFYAMRLVTGKPLQERIADFHNRLGKKKRRLNQDPDFVLLIESLISASHTIAYAHSVGVLHCDVKPQNIICGDFGATIVLDWGSAVTAPRASRNSNEQGKLIHCPEWTNGSNYTTAYASPEQKEQNPELDETTDVYSLGATLYEIVTGTTPIDHRDYQDRVNRDRIGAMRQHQPYCSRSLEAICIRALRQKVHDRYAGPEEFADDLSCWLRGEEIAARPDSFFDRLFRLANRHRTATLMVLAAIGLFFFAALGYNAERFQQLKLKASRELGFGLIEDICGPLENGELQSPEELKAVAQLVLDHCEKAIDDESAGIDDKLMLGRMHHLRSLTRYYYDNYLPTNTIIDGSPRAAEKTGWLDGAIDDIETATEMFQSLDHSTKTDYGNDIRQRLAGSSLFKARLHFRRYNRQIETGDDKLVELESAMAAIDSAKSYFQNSNPRQATNDHHFRLAEAYQLKGEILLRQAVQSDTTHDALAIYDAAKTAFNECNRILERLQPENDPARLRALGRASGYLGDVYRDQRQYKQALESFTASLENRRKIFEQDPSPENQFQLSRGYANFAWTLRNLGVVPGEIPTQADVASGNITNPIEPIELGELEPFVRQNQIKKLIDGYLGQFEENDPEKAPLALNLIFLLKEIEERSSQREVGNALCLMAELYYQAARQTDPVNREWLIEAKSLLQSEASDFDAEQILRALYEKNSDDRETKTGLAYCLTLLGQIDRELGSEPDMSVGEILDILPNVEGPLSNDELFLRCVVYGWEREDYRTKLNDGLRKLAASGYKSDWRIKQHFSDDDWKVFESHKSLTSIEHQ